MDKAKKNTVIHAAADRMAANYKSSQIPMYGDALRMPNRNAVIEIIRDCQKLIFPVYYGDRDLLKLPPEQYSALLMEHIHEKLTRQITLTMPECDENCEVAYAISTAFIERIPAIQELLLKDLSANFEGDPAAYSKEEVLLSYPGMFAIFIYRIAHELYEKKVAMIPRMMSEYAHSQTGIDINPGAKIGEYFFIDHGTGVVVGETTIIGDNVKLYQGVTLGALSPACARMRSMNAVLISRPRVWRRTRMCAATRRSATTSSSTQTPRCSAVRRRSATMSSSVATRF